MPTPKTLNTAIEADRAAENATIPSENCGHLFVLHCAAKGIAADAILTPTRDGQSVDAGTVKALTKEEMESNGFKGVTAVYEGQISTDSYTTEEEAVEGAMKVVASFISTAAPALKGSSSGFRRAKPLIALPMPGVGLVDVADLIKDMENIVRPLISQLYAAANTYGVDVAICTVDEGAFKVAQVLRERCCPFKGGPFWMLPAHMHEEVVRLKKQAQAGRLGILYGAGVSFPSGLPSWGGLLKELAEDAGFNEEERAALAELGFLDQPTIIEDKMGDRAKFKQAVAACVKHGRYTPAHSIMGSMHLPAVTTNYDTLYEDAVASAATNELERVQRLPWDASRLAQMPDGVRRVLKLHGCVRDPQSIVLTREDYMRYEDTRRALRGLLHQNLLEREYLVLGFSMTDDNVHLIIDQVRKTLERHHVDLKSFYMGTVVTLRENVMFRKLWSDDFRVVSCGKSWADQPAWIHDIFLDAVASEIVVQNAAASFILDESYEALLSPAQLKIKQALAPLQALANERDAAVVDSDEWGLLEQMLAKFGDATAVAKATNALPGAPTVHKANTEVYS